MKLQVTQENLNKALSSVARIASTRSTLPILANVLLKTFKNRLSVSAANLDIAVTHYIGAKVVSEGSITIPARLIQDLVSNLPSDVIDLNLEDNKLHINSKMYQSVMNGVSSEDFPVMPAISKGQTIKVEASLLKHSLTQVVVAASNDETRPVLTGVYFNSFGGKLYIVATDSYRLAEKLVAPTDKEINILVPASAISDLLRIMGDYNGEVSISYDEQQVSFSTGDIELVARLIDGKYPDYRQLIPKTFTTTISLPKTDLNNITKVSALFARESAGSITINTSEENQEISIHSVASQLGENTASAKAKVVGDGVVTMNSRYLLEALSVLDGEGVDCNFNGKLEPIVISNKETKNNYLHIIMPLKS
ncbi:MAG TPA: DNA polymerase III subunit beta [Candidatus Saccharimonadia bacterium]|nr:DNA polymerase III subunit beta [Candidatus Saccharimonadia bacterium]